ncbi:uncharacterized protein N7525_006282 [Penicillium rubens]|uniref:uncharacterized protein n=1 Tax=Penicillium rubens TaxID=1108849 RepID=UPI002A59AD93|nr:uncharacterized protein N7525_006282 [Penicillium rubens]KAJ5828029.1 hypothetical protein N7525_006282 [Penicillium rubens]
MSLFQTVQTPALTYEQPLGLFINNEFIKGVDGKTFETINPHNEKPIVAVHEGAEEDVNIAVKAARSALNGEWKQVTPSERGRLLTRLADFLERDIETLAAIEALDNGKGVTMAKGDVISGFGRTAGAAIAAHMDIDKVAFTGSTLVGRQIMKSAADSNLKKVTLELGGKSPNIVLPDANLDEAIEWVNLGIFFNHGQCCCAGSRILVHEAVYEKFLQLFKKRAEQNKVGDPFNTETFQGPQVSQIQYDRIMSYIKDGKGAGAKVVTGGDRHGSEGYYIQPTIFADVTEDMTIVKEEIFGPVCTVQKVRSEEEAIRVANDTNYGLAAAVHTTNINTAIRVSNAIKAGTVWVNNYNTLHYQMPFGGFKESGVGRELGSYALENYTEVKTVRVHLSQS